LGNCRGFNSWDEEAKYYNSLTPEQQRHWRIEGHAYMVSLRPENRGRSPVENWLQAEAENKRKEDLRQLWIEKSVTVDRTEKVRKSVIFYLAQKSDAPLTTFNDQTLLPQDVEQRSLLTQNVTWDLCAELLTLPETVQNIGQLTAFVIANYRRRQPRQHSPARRW